MSPMQTINETSNVRLVHTTRHHSPDKAVEMIFSVLDQDHNEQTVKAEIDPRELYTDLKDRNQLKIVGSAPSTSSYRSSNKQANQQELNVKLVYATKNEANQDDPIKAVFSRQEAGSEWLEYTEIEANELYQLCLEKGWASRPSTVRQFGRSARAA